MNIFKSIFGITVISVLGFVFMSMAPQQNPVQPWPVPDDFKNMQNPVEKNDANIASGQKLYAKLCATCHGKTGLGDGVVGRKLKNFPGDFTGDYYQNQTDGEHFYKTKYGRGEMPKYEGKCTDEDIWNMVHYMRTFKK